MRDAVCSGESVDHSYSVVAAKKGFQRVDRAVVNYKFTDGEGEEQVGVPVVLFRWRFLFVHISAAIHLIEFTTPLSMPFLSFPFLSVS